VEKTLHEKQKMSLQTHEETPSLPPLHEKQKMPRQNHEEKTLPQKQKMPRQVLQKT